MKPLPRLLTTNPLRGLDLVRLGALLDAGERGYYTELQWLYRYLEKRNATVRGVRRKLLSALGALDWDIKVRSDLDGERARQAEKQKIALRAAYERIGNLRAALDHLVQADLRGFAHCEKVYGAPRDAAQPTAGAYDVVELRPVPQHFFIREGGAEAEWQYNAELRASNTGGVPLKAGDWIVREIDDPAAEIFAIAHIAMSVTDADWEEFCQTYAVPPLFVNGPPNVAKGKEAEYQRVAELIVSAGRGYLPHGAAVSSVTPGSDPEAFTARLEYFQQQIVLAGTGGLLTMLTAPTGLGKGPSEEHGDTWVDIAHGIAMKVSETMQEQFDLPVLLARFGPEVEVLAYFEFAKPDEEDVAAHVANAKALGDAGYEIEIEELAEKTGYALVRKSEGGSGKPEGKGRAAEDDDEHDPTIEDY